MPNWKKVIVSGSNAVLNNITSSGNIKADGNISASSITTTTISAPGDSNDKITLNTDFIQIFGGDFPADSKEYMRFDDITDTVSINHLSSDIDFKANTDNSTAIFIDGGNDHFIIGNTYNNFNPLPLFYSNAVENRFTSTVNIANYGYDSSLNEDFPQFALMSGSILRVLGHTPSGYNPVSASIHVSSSLGTTFIDDGNISLSGNITSSGNISSSGDLTGNSFIKGGGTSAQFLKADGSVDSTAYTTNVGDITGVTAGTGLDGGATSGNATLTLNLTEVGFGGTSGNLVTDDGDGTVTSQNNLTYKTSTGTLSVLGTPRSSGFISASSDIVAGENIYAGGGLSVGQSGIFGGNVTATDIIVGDDVRLANNSKIISENQSSTYILLNNDDYWRINANGYDVARFASTGVVINESSNEHVDFRVESNNDTHALFVDSGNDKVAIGTSTVGDSLLTIDGDVTATNITASGAISASGKVYSTNINSIQFGFQSVGSAVQGTWYGPNNLGPNNTFWATTYGTAAGPGNVGLTQANSGWFVPVKSFITDAKLYIQNITDADNYAVSGALQVTDTISYPATANSDVNTYTNHTAALYSTTGTTKAIEEVTITVNQQVEAGVIMYPRFNVNGVTSNWRGTFVVNYYEIK